MGLSRDPFVHVPAGTFIYGPEECYERLGAAPQPGPRRQMDLAEFWMARAPVSYREWREFLEQTGYRWSGRWHVVVRGWRGIWLRAFAPTERFPDGHDDLPIVDVSHRDAGAYCDWLSERLGRRCMLPTEHQWEKAARGTDGRRFPWGDTPSRPEIQWQRRFPVGPETYVVSLIVRPRREWARAGWYWRNGFPRPIGWAPRNASPYGCLDMAGNVWEWTSSLYNPDLPGFHVVKGGSWGYSVHHVACNVRSACSVTTPSDRYRAPGTGFRVAIDPSRA